MSVASEKPTVAVSNLPQTITVLDLRHFLESQLCNDSIFALEISTERKQWKPRSFGRIQFTTLEAKLKAMAVPLTFESHTLTLSETTYDDIVVRPVEPKHRRGECCMSVLESWEGVRVWVMPERQRVEFWVWQGSECYRLEIMFHDVL
ncbi:rna-dependent rna polymerase 2 [Quercus suber]|uniref:Rna-dependent rna polymerase 2 n=1 Tax=Quercus suber TaxID=58331 RepID=A0AAW0MD05_QUESU